MTTITESRPWKLSSPGIRIAPSLLAADFARLRDEVAEIESAGAEMLHLDIMDGHFVPNISFGVPIVERLRGVSKLYFDTHLMISDPFYYAEMFVKAGSENLTFHIEVGDDARRVIEHVRSLGASVGIALNPGTPVAAIAPVAPLVDVVLVMSVWPGFGGQRFIASALDKLGTLRRLLRPDQRLEVDGGIGPDTIAQATEAGADTFVAGTSVYGTPDPAAAMRDLHARARSAYLQSRS